MQYARMLDGQAIEVIDAFYDANGVEVPLYARFPPDIAQQFVPYDPAKQPPKPELPKPKPPQSVTARQARLALLDLALLSAIDDALDALPSPQREQARIEWEFAGTIDRGSPLVVALGKSLKLDLDALFTAAALR